MNAGAALPHPGAAARPGRAAPLTRERAFPCQEGVRRRNFPTVMRAVARRRVIRHPPSGQGSPQAVAALAFTPAGQRCRLRGIVPDSPAPANQPRQTAFQDWWCSRCNPFAGPKGRPGVALTRLTSPAFVSLARGRERLFHTQEHLPKHIGLRRSSRIAVPPIFRTRARCAALAASAQKIGTPTPAVAAASMARRP